MDNNNSSYEIGNKPTYAEPIASKKKYSVCKSCKVQFKQDWDNKTGKYSEWDLCPKCREQISKIKTIKTNYTPYDYQNQMHMSTARFRIISGGIRSGKDFSMTFELFKYACACANEERPVDLQPVLAWIVAPNEYIATQNFKRLKNLIPSDLVADYSKSTNSILTKNGILFEIKSAYDPESLVAVALDCVLITEAARIKDLEDVWSNLEGRLNSPGRGLGGKGGIGLINSSPLGKNYFYKMWQWGNPHNPERDEDWESFKWTHWDNPEIAKKADIPGKNGLTYRQRLERRMSRNRYLQDYMAEFLADDYSVYPNFKDRCSVKIPSNLNDEERQAYIDEWRQVVPYSEYIIGYDPAGTKDAAPVVVFEKGTGKLVYNKDLRTLGWDGQFDEIARLQKKYNNAVVNFSKTGHEIIPSQFDKRGIIYNAFNEQGSNKAGFIENLAILAENKFIRILDDKDDLTERIFTEMECYQRTVKGSKITYSNGRGTPHDDFVSASYMAFADFEITKTVIPYVGMMCGLSK